MHKNGEVFKKYLAIVIPCENLAIGANSPWTMWPCLKRIRTDFTCKAQRYKVLHTGDRTCDLDNQQAHSSIAQSVARWTLTSSGWGGLKGVHRELYLNT